MKMATRARAQTRAAQRGIIEAKGEKAKLGIYTIVGILGNETTEAALNFDLRRTGNEEDKKRVAFVEAVLAIDLQKCQEDGKKAAVEIINRIGKGENLAGEQIVGWGAVTKALEDRMAHDRAEIKRIRKDRLKKFVGTLGSHKAELHSIDTAGYTPSNPLAAFGQRLRVDMPDGPSQTQDEYSRRLRSFIDDLMKEFKTADGLGELMKEVSARTHETRLVSDAFTDAMMKSGRYVEVAMPIMADAKYIPAVLPPSSTKMVQRAKLLSTALVNSIDQMKAGSDDKQVSELSRSNLAFGIEASFMVKHLNPHDSWEVIQAVREANKKFEGLFTSPDGGETPPKISGYSVKKVKISEDLGALPEKISGLTDMFRNMIEIFKIDSQLRTTPQKEAEKQEKKLIEIEEYGINTVEKWFGTAMAKEKPPPLLSAFYTDHAKDDGTVVKELDKAAVKSFIGQLVSAVPIYNGIVTQYEVPTREEIMVGVASRSVPNITTKKPEPWDESAGNN